MTVADIHIHTTYSADSSITPAALLQRAEKIGLDIVCITDHNVFEENIGVESLKNADKKPLLIRGVEIDTSNSELIIFGLTKDFWKELRSNMDLLPSVEKVIKAVSEFGGVAIWPHPFRDYTVTHYDTEYKKFHGVKIMEGMNGKNSTEENLAAIKYAKENGYKATGGSDAHQIADIGKCLTLFKNEIRTEKEFISALKNSDYIPITYNDFKGKDLSLFTF
ncbi:MAG: PHP domain-containing protein [Pseudomonadota bacterium]